MEKIVLLALADCENGDTLRCDPSQKFIAEKASVSERSVREMLQRLEDKGLIARTKRGMAGDGGGRQSDDYRLACRGLAADAAGTLTGSKSGGYRHAAAATENRKEPEDISGPVPEVSHDGPVDNFGTGHSNAPLPSATHGHPLKHADVFAAVGKQLPDTFDDTKLDILAGEIIARSSSRVLDPTAYVIRTLRNPDGKLEWLTRALDIDLEQHFRSAGSF
ncbi:MAG: helix-turn-helix domain-containing protein [Microbacterium enclense]